MKLSTLILTFLLITTAQLRCAQQGPTLAQLHAQLTQIQTTLNNQANNNNPWARRFDTGTRGFVCCSAALGFFYAAYSIVVALVRDRTTHKQQQAERKKHLEFMAAADALEQQKQATLMQAQKIDSITYNQSALLTEGTLLDANRNTLEKIRQQRSLLKKDAEQSALLDNEISVRQKNYNARLTTYLELTSHTTTRLAQTLS